MPSFLRPFLRPRALFLSAMMLVVAGLLWRNARVQHEVGRAEVAEWLRAAARAAVADRGAPVALGATDPWVADAFASWVRDAVPADRAADAKVAVEATGDGPFGSRQGDATHRASIELLGRRAEADVAWTADVRAVVGWRALPAGDPGTPQPVR